jgi:outer membrane protein assembly factor BamB
VTTRRRWSHLLIAFTLAVGCLLSPPAPTGGQEAIASVPFARGDAARTGRQPGPLPADDPLAWWRVGLGGPAGAPVVAGGVVYVADANQLRALDAITGAERWRAGLTTEVLASLALDVASNTIVAVDANGVVVALDLGGQGKWRTALNRHVESSPVIAAGLVVLGAGSELVALDLTSGGEVWRATLTGSIFSSPAVVNDRVVVGSGSSLHARDLATGTPNWEFDTGAPVTATPTIAADTVFAGNWDGSFLALDLATGSERWRIGFGGGIFASAAAAGDLVWIGDGFGRFVALEAATGTERWRIDTGSELRSSPVVVDELVILLDGTGLLRVLGGPTGEEAWRYGVGPSRNSLVAIDAMIYVVTDDGALIALGSAHDPRRSPLPPPDPLDPVTGVPMAGGGPARTGRQPGPEPLGAPIEQWRTDVGSDFSAPIVVARGLVLVGNRTSFLYALDAVTGQERWRFAAANWITTAPAVAGDTVIVGDDSGGLVALDLATGRPRWQTTLSAPVDRSIIATADVVVVSEGGALHAFETTTGTERWRLDTAGEVAIADDTVVIATDSALIAVALADGQTTWEAPVEDLTGSPVIVAGTVYVLSGAQILSFDIATGTVRPPLVLGGVYETLAIGDGYAVLTDRDGIIAAIDLVTGWRRWQVDTGIATPGFVAPVPAIVGATVYAGSTDYSGLVYAIDGWTGSEVWRFDTGVPGSATAPAVVGGVVYVGLDTQVIAIAGDANPPPPTPEPVATSQPEPTPAGETVPGAMLGGDAGRSGVQPGPAPEREPVERWRFTTEGEVRGGAIVADGVVYATDDAGYLYAIDASTGTERWRFQMNAGEATTPVVYDDVVIVGDGQFVYGVDADSGAERWNAPLPSGGAPALSGTDVLLSGPGTLAAVDVGGARGFVGWTYTPPDGGDAPGQLTDPAAGDGIVAVVVPPNRFAMESGYLVALAPGDGSERWRFAPDEAVVAGPSIVAGIVYAGGDDGTLWALAATTGDVVWESATGVEMTSTAAVGGGLVVAGNDDGEVVAVDGETGEERWRFETDDVVAAQPSIAGDLVVIASYDGRLYGLDLATGEERWQYRTGRETDGAATIVDGVVFVGAGQAVLALSGEG